jgi:hypothetical protein
MGFQLIPGGVGMSTGVVANSKEFSHSARIKFALSWHSINEVILPNY